MGAPFVLNNPSPAAVIGGGFIGPVHAEALRRLGVPIVGVLGSSPERARMFAHTLGNARVYQDLDELVRDDRARCVHVASPNDAHFEQVRALLLAGKHVVCEKPLAVSSSQTQELVDCSARALGQVAAVNYNIRFYPICQEMRARVARGDLGELIAVTGSYTQDWLLRPDDFNWRVLPDGGSNLRAVADVGTHWMDLAQFVTGRSIISVLADAQTVHPRRLRPRGVSDTFKDPRASEPAGPSDADWVEITTEDFAAVLLRFQGAARGVFHVSQVHAGRKNRLLIELAGTEASMTWDSESPELLTIGHRGRTSEILLRDPALLHPRVECHYPGGHAEGFPDSFKYLFSNVYHAIAVDDDELRGCYPTFEDGHREVRLCEAIAESFRTRTWVDLEPPR